MKDIGAKCGGTSIDRGFYQLLSEKLGTPFDNLSYSSVGPGSELMDRFEEVKRAFNGGERKYSLSLKSIKLKSPGASQSFFNNRTKEITLVPNDLRGFFDPVIQQIFSLILSQITLLHQEFNEIIINVSSLAR